MSENIALQRIRSWVEISTDLDDHSESNFYTGFANDLNGGGVFVATRDTLAVGTKAKIELKFPDGGPTLQVNGRVRWTRERHDGPDGEPGIGFEFVDLSDEARKRIESFLSRREPLFFDDNPITRHNLEAPPARPRRTLLWVALGLASLAGLAFLLYRAGLFGPR
ncbi:MAG: TIGR02266 family protein [Deltaproteobacteria bacterium]|nr:TIGR02266 family protein [Deltaproteobacteria bacterium]